MTEISIQCELDGVAIPGFPWLEARSYRHFYRRMDRITNISTYTNAVPTLDAATDYRVGFLMIVADKNIVFTVADPGDSPAAAQTLAAGTIFLVGNANALHSNTVPFVRVKPAEATNILMIAGLY